MPPTFSAQIACCRMNVFWLSILPMTKLSTATNPKLSCRVTPLTTPTPSRRRAAAPPVIPQELAAARLARGRRRGRRRRSQRTCRRPAVTAAATAAAAAARSGPRRPARRSGLILLSRGEGGRNRCAERRAPGLWRQPALPLAARRPAEGRATAARSAGRPAGGWARGGGRPGRCQGRGRLAAAAASAPAAARLLMNARRSGAARAATANPLMRCHNPKWDATSRKSRLAAKLSKTCTP
jgi:hypothetical protein